MGMTRDVIRSAINAFFKSYNTFTTIAAVLIFPTSLSILLSESLLSSSSSTIAALSARFRSLFHAAGFPDTDFFALFALKLSQTIFSYAVSLPLMLTFLILAKSCVIQILLHSPPDFAKSVRIYPAVLSTHIFNTFVVLSSNATAFSLLFLLFNGAEIIGSTSHFSIALLSTIGAVIYALLIATTTVICNLAIIIAGAENCDGYVSILKACILMRNRVGTALSLALPTSAGMALMEALFQFRIMRPYRVSGKFSPGVMWEAFSLTYVHAVLMVLEIIVSCVFYKRCVVEVELRNGGEGFEEKEWIELEPEEKAGVFLV